MSTKIFKESFRTKREDQSYEDFVEKNVGGQAALKRFDTFDDETYDININIANVKTKGKRYIKYSDVCPSKAPIVPGLVIGVMNEIERRIPPLYNITFGYVQDGEKSDTVLDSVIRNCKYVEDLPFTLFEEPLWILMQVLQMFLGRLEAPVFCVDLEIASDERHYNFPPKYNTGTVGKLAQSLDACLKKMRREQVAILAYLMEKIQLWTLKNVEYQLKRNSNLSKDQVYVESIQFFRSLFAPYVVGLPEAHLRAIELRKFQMGESLSCQMSNIFALISCDVGCDYWHQKSIEALSAKDADNECKGGFSRQLTSRLGKKTSSLGFHWV